MTKCSVNGAPATLKSGTVPNYPLLQNCLSKDIANIKTRVYSKYLLHKQQHDKAQLLIKSIDCSLVLEPEDTKKEKSNTAFIYHNFLGYSFNSVHCIIIQNHWHAEFKCTPVDITGTIFTPSSTRRYSRI